MYTHMYTHTRTHTHTPIKHILTGFQHIISSGAPCPQLRFIHIHQLFRIQYTCFELDTANTDWWICANFCLVSITSTIYIISINTYIPIIATVVPLIAAGLQGSSASGTTSPSTLGGCIIIAITITITITIYYLLLTITITITNTGSLPAIAREAAAWGFETTIPPTISSKLYIYIYIY